MKKYILPILLFCGGCFSSCVDDEGNYDYTHLDDYSISGLESAYSVLAYIDSIKIEPVVENTIEGKPVDENNLEYEWHICYSVEIDANNSISHNHVPISTEKNLDWLVDVAPGSYRLYFVVRDKATQLESHTYTDILVKESLGRGFMVLGDVDGSPELGLDMLVMAPNRDTVYVENVFDNSELQLTGAEDIVFTGLLRDATKANIWLMTHDQTYKLDLKDFHMIGTFQQQNIIDNEYDFRMPMLCKGVYPTQLNAPYGGQSERLRYYVTEEAVFGGSIMSYEVFNEPLNRYSATSKEFFKFYPKVFAYVSAYSPNMMAYAFLYDMDADKIVVTNSNFSPTCCADVREYNLNPWSCDFASQNRTLVYGEPGTTNSNASFYMIVKDKTNPEYFIYRAILSSAYGAYPTSKYLHNVDLGVATDFDKASFYAFPSYNTRMVYAAGNKLYQYDYGRNAVSSMEFDGEITYLHVDKASAGRTQDVIVATWNDSTKGKIYKLSIDTNPNTMEFTTYDAQVWSTRLKVKKVEWKNS